MRPSFLLPDRGIPWRHDGRGGNPPPDSGKQSDNFCGIHGPGLVLAGRRLLYRTGPHRIFRRLLHQPPRSPGFRCTHWRSVASNVAGDGPSRDFHRGRAGRGERSALPRYHELRRWSSRRLCPVASLRLRGHAGRRRCGKGKHQGSEGAHRKPVIFPAIYGTFGRRASPRDTFTRDQGLPPVQRVAGRLPGAPSHS